MSLTIAAICYISMSELRTVCPWLNTEWIDNNPDKLKEMLFDLGMDIDYPIDTQYVEHRNRFGNLYTGLRWVGNERIDRSWLESGYSSQEARDKALGSKILTDAYRLRGLTESE